MENTENNVERENFKVGKFLVGEINYVKANLDKTDIDISAALNRTPWSVAALRKRLGIKKSKKKVKVKFQKMLLFRSFLH